MAKKQFTNSFQDIFSPTETPSVKEEVIIVPEIDDEIIRTTILLNKKTYESIKSIAFWKRCQIKDLIDKALISVINSYTKDQLSEMYKEFSQKGNTK